MTTEMGARSSLAASRLVSTTSRCARHTPTRKAVSPCALPNPLRRATRAQIRTDFRKYGGIEDVYLPTERDTGRTRGFGFVTFMNPDDAEEAAKDMHR